MKLMVGGDGGLDLVRYVSKEFAIVDFLPGPYYERVMRERILVRSC